MIVDDQSLYSPLAWNPSDDNDVFSLLQGKSSSTDFENGVAFDSHGFYAPDLQPYEDSSCTPVNSRRAKTNENLSVASATRRKKAENRKRRRSCASSPVWPNRRSCASKSFSSSLSRFTLPDETGKRKIRNDIMSIAESLPALPGLYFDKKQKGFRVRYQNVYVGWVALSRFPSIEEAYCSARSIWENAKAHAEKFQSPHAAVMASLPLQKEAQASGKNRGGRPRTVTQLPQNTAEYFCQRTAIPQPWTPQLEILNAPPFADSYFDGLLGDGSSGDQPAFLDATHWTPPSGYAHSLLTPASTKASEASPPLSSPPYVMNLVGDVPDDKNCYLSAGYGDPYTLCALGGDMGAVPGKISQSKPVNDGWEEHGPTVNEERG